MTRNESIKHDIVSPQIGADRCITFRIFAPIADEVSLNGSLGQDLPFTKDENHIWSLTVGPVKPGIHAYTFEVDGVTTVDPANQYITSYLPPSSVLEVIGDSPAPWDLRPVSHGEVHVHWYASKSLGVQRRMHVYTPPDYCADSRDYPVLYLLHGWGNTDAAWTQLGHANFILDNLIADGKAEPMIVVMPHDHTFDPFKTTPEKEVGKLTADFEKDLLSDIIPLVERKYRVRGNRDDRAIAGLSMGGALTLEIGLGHLDTFSWVGAFSTGLQDDDRLRSNLSVGSEKVNKALHLLWMGCGTGDWLYHNNTGLVKMLQEKGINHTWHTSEGGHVWQIWREYLPELVPLLFRS